MKKNNKLQKVIWIPILVLSFFIIPYLVEKLVLSISGSTFNPKFTLAKEVWFGFIGSYLGAVGTVILGFVAIWQNKRYKELSDNSSKEVMEIQGELRNLNKRIVDAIETLQSIELAVYTPAIQNIHYNYYNVQKESLDKNFGNCAYQINRINIFDENPLMPLEELMEKYITFAFAIRNIGEKPIRDFFCRVIEINGNTLYHRVSSSTDIASGEIAIVILANLNLEDGDKNINLVFEFNTLILERYRFDVNVFIGLNNDAYECHIYPFEDPVKIQNDKKDSYFSIN